MLQELPEKYPVEELLQVYQMFPRAPQINITSHDGNTYTYESNRLVDLEWQEKDLIRINGMFVGTLFETIYHELDAKYGVCRGRIMTMDREVRAYSYHRDPTKRIHIPLTTSDLSLFLVDMEFYRMPTVGQAYLLDTTHDHTALNLGWDDRTHLLFSLKE